MCTKREHRVQSPRKKRRGADGLFITSEDNRGLNLQHELFSWSHEAFKKTPFSATFENTPVIVFRARNVWKIHVLFKLAFKQLFLRTSWRILWYMYNVDWDEYQNGPAAVLL